MAGSFRIYKHKTSESLYLNLMGDFDGSAASELIQVLKDSADTCFSVFVNTTGLRKIYPFGCEVMHMAEAELKKKGANILFVGRNISQLNFHAH